MAVKERIDTSIETKGGLCVSRGSSYAVSSIRELNGQKKSTDVDGCRATSTQGDIALGKQ